MNTYTTIYDSSTTSPDWIWLGFLCVLLLVALFVYFYVPYWPHRQKLLNVALLLSFLTGLQYGRDRWMLGKLRSGSCSVVSGHVTNYWTSQDYHVKTDINGRAVKVWYTYEGFRINNVAFSYTIGASTYCFKNGEKPRLSIRDGMTMRIHYYPEPVVGSSPANRIIKLEVPPSDRQPLSFMSIATELSRSIDALQPAENSIPLSKLSTN